MTSPPQAPFLSTVQCTLHVQELELEVKSSNPEMSDCHIVTPLILSEPLSRLAGQKVYLKLDSLQPSGKLVSTHVGAYLRINYN